MDETSVVVIAPGAPNKSIKLNCGSVADGFGNNISPEASIVVALKSTTLALLPLKSFVTIKSFIVDLLALKSTISAGIGGDVNVMLAPILE